LIATRNYHSGEARPTLSLGEDFDGWTVGAAWDDTKLGLLHLADFSRIALVSDIEWIRRVTKLFAPFLGSLVLE